MAEIGIDVTSRPWPWPHRVELLLAGVRVARFVSPQAADAFGSWLGWSLDEQPVAATPHLPWVPLDASASDLIIAASHYSRLAARQEAVESRGNTLTMRPALSVVDAPRGWPMTTGPWLPGRTAANNLTVAAALLSMAAERSAQQLAQQVEMPSGEVDCG